VRRILYIVFLLCIANVSFAQKENANDKDTPAPSTDPNTQYTGIGGYIGASIFKGKPYLLLGY
jgi:hypothetical protein